MDIIKKIKNNNLIANICSLLILQGFNYILPLITFPYLVRTLGDENYGVLNFSFAFIQYLIIICDFGFNFTATRNIAVNRENPQKIQQIFSTVILLKLGMCALSFLLMVGIIMNIPEYSVHLDLFMVMFISVIGSCIFPIWFFQGIENMRLVSIINIVSKVISTALIFIVVQGKDDLLLAALFQSIGYLLPGMIGFIFVIYSYKIQMKFKVSFEYIKQEVQESWQVFISTLSSNIYGQGSIIILGIISTKQIVGYYSISQKIAISIVGLAQPFAQGLYPYMCKLYVKDVLQYQKVMKVIKICTFLISIAIGFVTFLGKSYMTLLITGEKNNYIDYLMGMWSIILILTINNVIYNIFILSMKKYKQMKKMYLIVAILFLCIAIPLTNYMDAVGICLSLIFVEVFIFIYSWIITRHVES